MKHIPILSPDAFIHVFEPFRGKRVRLFSGPGNVGDDLIDAATRQLFKHYDILEEEENKDVDVVMYGGGGNMGSLYRETFLRRQKAKAFANKLDVPFVILSQSWNARGEKQDDADLLYARELRSLFYCPEAILAPDLALAYTLPDEWTNPAIKEEVGYFFRLDKESKLKIVTKDPIKLCPKVIDYINLAASYREVHTDRLHFAISCMIVKTKVFLYPNSYHKNKSIYDLWLRGRGCEWRDTFETKN